MRSGHISLFCPEGRALRLLRERVQLTKNEKYATTVDIIRQIALTGRRSEIIGLRWYEVDTEGELSAFGGQQGGRFHSANRTPGS